MKPGDLVALKDPANMPRGYDPLLWKAPAYTASADTMAGVVVGELHMGDAALVIEVDDEEKEAKVLTSRGEIGWMWRAVLRVVE